MEGLRRVNPSRFEAAVIVEGVGCDDLWRRIEGWAQESWLSVCPLLGGPWMLLTNDAGRWSVHVRVQRLADGRSELGLGWRADARPEAAVYAEQLLTAIGERWQVRPLSAPCPQTGAASGGQADAGATRPPEALRGRNAEIMRLWRDGLTYRQIGDQFGLAPKTIENRIGALRRRLGSDRVPIRRSGWGAPGNAGYRPGENRGMPGG